MSQDIRFCTTADNVKLAYALSGEGPPLVMSATWLSHLEHPLVPQGTALKIFRDYKLFGQLSPGTLLGRSK